MKHLAWLLAFGSGYLSLSEEILWVRFVGFSQAGVPHAFALVLSLYLMGIALGAVVGKRVCESNLSVRTAASFALALAGALSFAIPSILTAVASADPLLRFMAPLLLIVLSAALKAVVFPLAHHLGTAPTSQRLGQAVSSVYAMNIVGSTMGPLVTGFVLLDFMGMEAGFQWIGLGSLLLAGAAAWNRHRVWSLGAWVLCMLGATLIESRSYPVLAAYAAKPEGTRVSHIVSNRHGVIHTVRSSDLEDIVYGGNAYDGRTNTDLVVNSNRIDRVYLLSVLHNEPRRILVIGLSTGAWLDVLLRFPEVRHVDVVEINPGYLELISKYPQLSGLLVDSRVVFHVDDGRRWLRRHADERYDLIVMNTTFHWRANITNLVSEEFLISARAHLAENGLLAYNSTGSVDVLHTAASVFPHAYLWGNFVYAANHDFRARLIDDDALRRLMQLAPASELQGDGGGVAYEGAARRVLATPFVTASEASSALGRPPVLITDRSMPTEFRFGRGLSLD